jgi:hypothetical protein
MSAPVMFARLALRRVTPRFLSPKVRDAKSPGAVAAFARTPLAFCDLLTGGFRAGHNLRALDGGARWS